MYSISWYIFKPVRMRARALYSPVVNVDKELLVSSSEDKLPEREHNKHKRPGFLTFFSVVWNPPLNKAS